MAFAFGGVTVVGLGSDNELMQLCPCPCRALTAVIRASSVCLWRARDPAPLPKLLWRPGDGALTCCAWVGEDWLAVGMSDGSVARLEVENAHVDSDADDDDDDTGERASITERNSFSRGAFGAVRTLCWDGNTRRLFVQSLSHVVTVCWESGRILHSVSSDTLRSIALPTTSLPSRSGHPPLVSFCCGQQGGVTAAVLDDRTVVMSWFSNESMTPACVGVEGLNAVCVAMLESPRLVAVGCTLGQTLLLPYGGGPRRVGGATLGHAICKLGPPPQPGAGDGAVSCLAWCPLGESLLVAWASGRAAVFSRSGVLTSVFSGCSPTRTPTPLAWLGSAGSRVALGWDRAGMRVFDVARPVWRCGSPPILLGWDVVLIATGESTVRLPLPSHYARHHSPARYAAMSGSGDLIAVAGGRGLCLRVVNPSRSSTGTWRVVGVDGRRMTCLAAPVWLGEAGIVVGVCTSSGCFALSVFRRGSLTVPPDEQELIEPPLWVDAAEDGSRYPVLSVGVRLHSPRRAHSVLVLDMGGWLSLFCARLDAQDRSSRLAPLRRLRLTQVGGSPLGMFALVGSSKVALWATDWSVRVFDVRGDGAVKGVVVSRSARGVWPDRGGLHPAVSSLVATTPGGLEVTVFVGPPCVSPGTSLSLRVSETAAETLLLGLSPFEGLVVGLRRWTGGLSQPPAREPECLCALETLPYAPIVLAALAVLAASIPESRVGCTLVAAGVCSVLSWGGHVTETLSRCFHLLATLPLPVMAGAPDDAVPPPREAVLSAAVSMLDGRPCIFTALAQCARSCEANVWNSLFAPVGGFIAVWNRLLEMKEPLACGHLLRIFSSVGDSASCLQMAGDLLPVAARKGGVGLVGDLVRHMLTLEAALGAAGVACAPVKDVLQDVAFEHVPRFLAEGKLWTAQGLVSALQLSWCDAIGPQRGVAKPANLLACLRGLYNDAGLVHCPAPLTRGRRERLRATLEGEECDDSGMTVAVLLRYAELATDTHVLLSLAPGLWAELRAISDALADVGLQEQALLLNTLLLRVPLLVSALRRCPDLQRPWMEALREPEFAAYCVLVSYVLEASAE